VAVSFGDPSPTLRTYDFAVNYAAGPFGAGLGFEKQKDGDQQFAIRGNYETGPFLVTGYVQRYKSNALKASQTIYRVSGQYTIGAAELHLAYGSQGDVGSSPAGEASAKQFTVGANYNLSKRTKVFTFYNMVKVDAPAALDPKVISVGVRHNF
jgi:predicted porin